MAPKALAAVASCAALLFSHAGLAWGQSTSSPTVTVRNGSYYGLYNSYYNQDLFLGMPYAQPPVGDLRFHIPVSLNTSWTGTRNATAYSPECIGYGSDDWVLGNYVSEDCLTINVVRPSGLDTSSDLPVAVWIHGGGFFEGGSSDPRYNLSFIVQQSVDMGKPFVAVSMNYRLAQWGFLLSQELYDAGITNVALRDQRLALHWVQENIAAFGGDPSKVTIWGESAGAFGVALQLVAYGGRDDGLFRGAIQESGGAAVGQRLPTPASKQAYFNSVVNATNCTSASDVIACLRTIPTDTLSDIFNSSSLAEAEWDPCIDHDFLPISGATALKNGSFVKVPLLIGTNFDEGGAFGTTGINTTTEFLADVLTSGVDNATALTLAALYPDIPEIGIPATLHGRPPPSEVGEYGYQWKRSAAFTGDLIMHAQRRLTTQSWAKFNQTAYSYHFNVLVHGVSYLRGAVHFQEVAFVFNNIHGQGYNTSVAEDPFEDEPDTFVQLANIMSRAWVSFVVDGDPNKSGATNITWPVYNLENPQNIVFDVNRTGLMYPEPDIYRAEGIAYISERLNTVLGR